MRKLLSKASHYLVAVMVFASFISILSPKVDTAQAACDTAFYESNDITWYNPCEVVRCSGAGSVTKLVGEDNRQKIYNFWIAQKMTPEQAAGITGSMQSEGGFSPFRQEISQTWPAGGYGIAQFTGGQRTAVTAYLKKDTAVKPLFEKYYSNEYGGAVNEEKKFIPTGVPVDVNDKFLLGELNYLATYISGFVPSTISTRVEKIKADYDQSVNKGQKLMAYLKTLKTPGDAAIAWTYLYEYPADIKATSAQRAGNADAVFKKYKTGAEDSQSCSTIGSGGLNYEQGVTFMTNYFNGKDKYFKSLNSGFGNFWSTKYTDQCTTFVAYFVSRFVMAAPSIPNGGDVVGRLTGTYPKSFKKVDKKNIQPYTVFSGTNAGAGHTGVILGILDDGSIVVGEGNATMSGSGIIKQKSMGVKNDRGKGLVAVEHWKSIDAWEKAMKQYYGSILYATPTDISATSEKMTKFMSSIGGN